jgi:hypothetical protein
MDIGGLGFNIVDGLRWFRIVPDADSVSVEKLKNTTKKLSKNSLYSGRIQNRSPPEQKFRVLRLDHPRSSGKNYSPIFSSLQVEYLILHGHHRKHRVQHFFCCCVCIRCSWNVFAKSLPSNDRLSWLTSSGF